MCPNLKCDEQRVALVTGGTRGIGLGIARALAREGCNLALCGRRAKEAVAAPLEELRQLGAEVFYGPCDVANAEERAQLLAAVEERFDSLDVLVNNAGIAPAVRTDILEAGEEGYEQVMNTNLRGPYFLTQAVAKKMLEQKRTRPERPACIVNISSVSATMATPDRGAYCMSKAGLSMATKLWAVRLAASGIPVYEVRPGVTETDMTAPAKEKYDRLIAEGLVPQGRWGQPDDVGRAVASLVRGDFAYSTGQVLMVDGGLALERL